jgi:hypothetical protein
MGDWYVIANIPHAIEKEAYNAIESYKRHLRSTRALLMDRLRPINLVDLFRIRIQMLFGACSFFGRLKQSTASYILLKIIPTNRHWPHQKGLCLDYGQKTFYTGR